MQKYSFANDCELTNFVRRAALKKLVQKKQSNSFKLYQFFCVLLVIDL